MSKMWSLLSVARQTNDATFNICSAEDSIKTLQQFGMVLLFVILRFLASLGWLSTP